MEKTGNRDGAIFQAIYCNHHSLINQAFHHRTTQSLLLSLLLSLCFSLFSSTQPPTLIHNSGIHVTSLWLSAHVHTGDKLKEKPDPPPPLAQQLCYAVGAFCCRAYNLKRKDCANQYKVFLIVIGGVSSRMTGHEGS